MTRSGVALCLLALAGCAGETVTGSGLTLRDPLGVLDDLDGDMALLVLSTDGQPYVCNTDGTVMPRPLPDAMGTIPGALVDVALPVMGSGSAAMGMEEVTVPAGDYVVWVEGRGVDMASGEPFTATGCQAVAIAKGETRDVSITLQQIFDPGMCGDGRLAPEEQCDDGGTTPGDGCDASCRTEEFQINNQTTEMSQTLPSVGWADNESVVSCFTNSTPAGVHVRLLSTVGEAITSPAAAAIDQDIESLPGPQTQCTATVRAGRAIIAFTDIRDGGAMGGDVFVKFLDAGDTGSIAPAAIAHASRDGAQLEPAIASMPDGNVLVVFADSTSANGIRGRHYAAGSTTPSGADAVDFAGGASGATAPAVAAHGSGFVVAFAAGGDVFFQRADRSGAPMEMARPVVEGAAASGTQDQPAVAALPDGRFLVAFHDDAMGIRARAFDASGAPVGSGIVVNTTGQGQLPTATAGRERFVVAWQAGASVRARMLDGEGLPARNREPSPSTDDFVVAVAGEKPSIAAGGPDLAGRWIAVYEARGDVFGRLFALP